MSSTATAIANSTAQASTRLPVVATGIANSTTQVIGGGPGVASGIADSTVAGTAMLARKATGVANSTAQALPGVPGVAAGVADSTATGTALRGSKATATADSTAAAGYRLRSGFNIVANSTAAAVAFGPGGFNTVGDSVASFIAVHPSSFAVAADSSCVSRGTRVEVSAGSAIADSTARAGGRMLFVSKGGMEAGGPGVDPKTAKTSRGGISVGGESKAFSTFQVTKEFSFNAGACIQYWWQVNGVCQNFGCVVSDGSKLSSVLSQASEGNACKRMMQVTLVACNLQEVCKNLSEKGYNFTIDTIYKYTQPVYQADAKYFSGCGTFVEVYPHNNDTEPHKLPLDCMEYFLSGEVKEEWSVECSVEFSGYIPASGGLGFGAADSDVKFNSYAITGEGGVTLGSGIGKYLGVFEVECGVLDEFLSLEKEFTNDLLPGGLEASQDIVVGGCDCGPYPLSLMSGHNLNKSDKLKSFLDRNSLTLPDMVQLEYNVLTYSWQSNFHFKGYSDDGNTQETWNLVFDWACTDAVGAMITSQIWKYSLYIKQKNLISGKTADTRVLLGFFPSEVCVPGYGLRYSFKLNTRTKEVYAAPYNINVDLNTCYDGAGVFAGNSWLKNPVLNVSVYEGNVPSPTRKVDISSLVPKRIIVFA